MNTQARIAELTEYLQRTQADQGGEATWEDWLDVTAEDDTEFAHEEAVELKSLLAAN